MRGGHGLIIFSLLEACSWASQTPVTAPPPDTPQIFVDQVAAGDSVAPVPVRSRVPTPSGINQPYREQTNPREWATRFEREGREVFDHRDEILDVLGLRPGLRAADVGAGTGLFTLALAERVGSLGRVYAVDVQPYFLDHIEQKARAQRMTWVEVVLATQHSVGLPQASIDLALLCDSYHHVEDPSAYLASLYTALRPGGRLVVVDYRAEPGVGKPWILDHVRAEPQQFRAEIEAAGFRLIRSHEGLLEENFLFEFERPPSDSKAPAGQ